MKPFFAFKGYKYYPLEGMGDFIGQFDTLEEAIGFLKEYKKKDRFDCLWWGRVVYMGDPHPTIVYKCCDGNDWEEEFEEEFVTIPIIPT